MYFESLYNKTIIYSSKLKTLQTQIACPPESQEQSLFSLRVRLPDIKILESDSETVCYPADKRIGILPFCAGLHYSWRLIRNIGLMLIVKDVAGNKIRVYFNPYKTALFTRFFGSSHLLVVRDIEVAFQRVHDDVHGEVCLLLAVIRYKADTCRQQAPFALRSDHAHVIRF